MRTADREMVAELVRDHHRALVALVIPIVGAGDAEEVVQSTWIKAWQGLPGFEGRSSVRTWLSRIAINEAKMALRRKRSQPLLNTLEATPGGDVLAERFAADGHWKRPPAQWHCESPDELLMAEQLARCLERLLGEMPANQRSLLELRDTAGLSFDEICNELDISASNARVLLHRARAQLFQLVDHYQETGEC